MVVEMTDGFEIVGEAENGEEAVEMAAALKSGPGPHGRADARHQRSRGHSQNHGSRRSTAMCW